MKPRSLRLNALFNVAGIAAEAVGTAVLVPYVLRRLGVESFGLITSVVSIGIISQMLAQSALVVVIRQVAAIRGAFGESVRLSDELKATKVSAILLAGLAIIGVSSIVLFQDRFLEWLHVEGALASDAKLSMSILAGILPFMLVGSLFPAILKGRERFGAANSLKAASVLIRVALVFVVFEVWKGSVSAFVAIRCGSVALEGALAAIALSSSREPKEVGGVVRATGESATSAIAQSGALLAYSLGNLLVLEVSKSVIGGMYDLRALGVFGAASMAASLVARLGQAISSLFTPAVSRLDGSGNQTRSSALMKRGTILTTALMAGAAVASFPAWKLVVPLWLGKQLEDMWPIVALAFAGQGIVSAISPSIFSAYGRGRVVGISLVHLGANATSLLLAILMSRNWHLGLLGFVLVLVTVRSLGACANFFYASRYVFGFRERGIYGHVLGLLVVAALIGGGAGLATEAGDLTRIPATVVALLSLTLFGGFCLVLLRRSPRSERRESAEGVT